jgi:hypothetical protein
MHPAATTLAQAENMASQAALKQLSEANGAAAAAQKHLLQQLELFESLQQEKAAVEERLRVSGPWGPHDQPAV